MLFLNQTILLGKKMKISKKNLNFLIDTFLFESEEKETEQEKFDRLNAQHIERYGYPLSKESEAYKSTKPTSPTVYFDELKKIPNTASQNKDNYPSLEDFYEEYISLATLVRQNTSNLNGLYPKIAQDKYDIKRILKKLKMKEDPIFINK